MATEKTKIEEIELTEEENKGQLRTYENDILKGLLAAANYETEEENIHPIEIARNGVVLFTFHIRPLSEEEYQKCKDKNTKYVRNKQLGIKFPENTDSVRYRSALIYQATIKEDREKIWDNKLSALKHFQNEVTEVSGSQECGILFNGYEEFQTGDTIECYVLEELPRTL